MAKSRRPKLKVLFTGQADMAEHTKGVGELMSHRVDIPELVDKVKRLLAE